MSLRQSCLFGLLLCVGALGSVAVAASRAGVVIYLKGEVSAGGHGDAQVRTLGRGTAVYVGDTLTTGAGSRLQVRMLDNAVLTLGADTVMQVRRYDFRSQSGNGAALLGLVKGVFRAVSGLIAHRPDPHFEVATPVGTIGIRGTDFWGGLGYFEPGKLEVAMLSGKGVYLRNAAGITELRQAGNGCGTHARSEAPSPAVAWPTEKLARAQYSVALDGDAAAQAH